MTSFFVSGGEGASQIARHERTHTPGEPGLWILICGDITVFTILFVVYLLARSRARPMFADSQRALHSGLGAFNTLVLLTSSMLLVLAIRAVREHRWRSSAQILAIAATIVGSVFVVVKVTEYHAMVAAGLVPTTNEFFMYYYMLTGLHLVHVVAGLGVLVAICVMARRPAPTGRAIAFMEGGGCFWHMVDLLWVVIFPLLFLVR